MKEYIQNDDRIYIEHILTNLSKANKYLKNVEYENFLENEEKQDVVIRKIEVIGVAAKRLSPEFLEKHHHIPWRAVAEMRDKLIMDILILTSIQFGNSIGNPAGKTFNGLLE